MKRILLAGVLLSLLVVPVYADSWNDGIIEAHPKEGLSMNHLFGVAGVVHHVTLSYGSAEQNRAILESTRVYDWGDGSPQTTVQPGIWELEHTWFSPGIYNVRVDVTLQDGVTFSRSTTLAMFKIADQAGFSLTQADQPIVLNAPESGNFGALLLWEPALQEEVGATISYLAVNGQRVDNLYSGPYTSGVQMSYEFVYASQDGGRSLSLQVIGGGFVRLTCSKATLYYLPAANSRGPIRARGDTIGGIRPALGAPKL